MMTIMIIHSQSLNEDSVNSLVETNVCLQGLDAGLGSRDPVHRPSFLLPLARSQCRNLRRMNGDSAVEGQWQQDAQV